MTWRAARIPSSLAPVSGRHAKDEAGAADTMDQRSFIRTVHFVTQPAHMHVD
jgi:hypothetical protein